MKVDCTLFARHGVMSPNGLFSLLEAGIATMFPPHLPITLKSLYFLVRLSLEPNECGEEYPCIVKVKSPSGEPLSEAMITIKGIAETPTFAALYDFGGSFIMSETGEYLFCVFVNDNCLGEFPLKIKIAQQTVAS